MVHACPCLILQINIKSFLLLPPSSSEAGQQLTVMVAKNEMRLGKDRSSHHISQIILAQRPCSYLSIHFILLSKNDMHAFDLFAFVCCSIHILWARMTLMLSIYFKESYTCFLFIRPFSKQEWHSRFRLFACGFFVWCPIRNGTNISCSSLVLKLM